MKDKSQIEKELYSKMENELNNYLSELRKLSVEQVIDSAYELTVKKEMLYCFHPGSTYYDAEELSLLNKEKEPLQLLYDRWLKDDGGIHQSFEYTISSSLEKLAEQAKTNRSLEVR